jgi:hypothetical protein
MLRLLINRSEEIDTEIAEYEIKINKLLLEKKQIKEDIKRQKDLNFTVKYGKSAAEIINEYYNKIAKYISIRPRINMYYLYGSIKYCIPDEYYENVLNMTTELVKIAFEEIYERPWKLERY